ncbi:MAG: class I SAM-dependent methyltransferase [Candidatus Thorarchaeota archaeon]
MSLFDELAAAYDNAIDWDSRLSREIPFILKSISSTDTKRVLDMACGSGRHSVELAELGFTVDAFDTSFVMIDIAKNLAKDRGVEVTFVVDDMMNLETRYHDSYDIILCLGNSLALLPSIQDLTKVVLMVSSLLSENGAFVFQTLNFDEIAASGFEQFEPKKGKLFTGEDVIFRRRFDHSEDLVDSTTLVLSSSIRRNDEWVENESRQKVIRVNSKILSQILENNGFKHFEIYANYHGHDFDKATSRSMVVRAKKF